MIEAGDLIIIAFLSGIGNALGQPIGKWIYEHLHRHKKRAEKIITEVYGLKREK